MPKATFESLVAQLRAEDPRFAKRIDQLAAPNRRRHMTLAVLLWTMTPFCIVIGGWTGFFFAVVAAVHALRLARKRGGLEAGTGPWMPRRSSSF